MILAERDKLVMDAELGSILRECKIKVITREGQLSVHFCSSPNHNFCPVAPLDCKHILSGSWLVETALRHQVSRL